VQRRQHHLARDTREILPDAKLTARAESAVKSFSLLTPRVARAAFRPSFQTRRIRMKAQERQRNFFPRSGMEMTQRALSLSLSLSLSYRDEINPRFNEVVKRSASKRSERRALPPLPSPPTRSSTEAVPRVRAHVFEITINIGRQLEGMFSQMIRASDIYQIPCVRACKVSRARAGGGERTGGRGGAESRGIAARSLRPPSSARAQRRL